MQKALKRFGWKMENLRGIPQKFFTLKLRQVDQKF